jgi:RNA polymerase sigma-70 factor (ECF subfamily)
MFSSYEVSESMMAEYSITPHLLETNELREIIEAAINKLPEKCRQIYLLAWEDNLSHKEIAGKLGITPKTVENHVGIALRKLRESLKPYYEQIFMLWMMGFFLD